MALHDPILFHEGDRYLRLVNHPCRYRAKHEAPQAPESARAHDNLIGMHLARRPNDGVADRAEFPASLEEDAGLLTGRQGIVQSLCRPRYGNPSFVLVLGVDVRETECLAVLHIQQDDGGLRIPVCQP